MRFSNPLISLVAAIALASSVIASTIPERRGDSPPTQSCTTGSSTCCTNVSPFTSLSSATQDGLLPLLGLNTVTNIPVGTNCALPGLLGCNNDAFCCQGAQSQNGLINVGLNCVKL